MVVEYFLEDIVQMINYKPSFEYNKKTNVEKKDSCNLLISDMYPKKVKEIVATIREDSKHFKIVEVRFVFIV